MGYVIERAFDVLDGVRSVERVFATCADSAHYRLPVAHTLGVYSVPHGVPPDIILTPPVNNGPLWRIGAHQLFRSWDVLKIGRDMHSPYQSERLHVEYTPESEQFLDQARPLLPHAFRHREPGPSSGSQLRKKGLRT